MTEPLNHVTAMAHAQPGLPVGELKAGHEPLDFELAIPAAAMCPGHHSQNAVKSSAASGKGSFALTVSIRDAAIGRQSGRPRYRRLRRPAGRLLDPDPNTPAGGAGGFPDD
ncbi:hypothetical protein LKL35_34655 [Streptomyces sp. ET3-23]|uniref:hypothetical protein n=1 Tax=Streptomyces sp. ET3-23 TaxID=2885643 RepID=UPI001D12B6B1|nr:hypothetical protein [Streptomyces sp. ET3-23]MCC2280511.1 hypothetical protein [Streptomyces sp. ET3-23]